MTNAQKALVTLLRSSLTGESLGLPEGIDFEEIYSEAKRHHVTALAYDGAVKCGVDRSLEGMHSLVNGYCAEMLVSEKQLNTLKGLCDAFEQAGIDYLCLKGAHLKSLYPKPEMRRMNDADILIREEDFDRARVVTEAQGFAVAEFGADHSKNFTCPSLYLELHLRLIARNEFPVCAEYFGTGWDSANHVEGHRYELAAEAEYIFLLVHLLKHFISGGVGCRQVCDLWMFKKKNESLDMDFVRSELEQLGLAQFHENLTKLLGSWFEGAEDDQKATIMGDYILECGAWGTPRTNVMSAGMRTYSKVKSTKAVRSRTILTTIFPPRAALTGQFPVLEKAPYLLPFCWVARCFRIVFFDRLKITRRAEEFKLVSPKNMEAHERMMDYIGANSLK